MKILFALGAAALLGILWIAFCAFVLGTFCLGCFAFHHHGGSNERRASNGLRTIAMAEADFRANDRDGDKISQFWRADVAGLYGFIPQKSVAIKLIERSLAEADDRPRTSLDPAAVPSPSGGYWFLAIRHVDEDPQAPSPDRFAFCAFPMSPNAGKWIFIIDENNTVYRAETKGRRGIDVFPSEEELKTQWSKID